MTQPSRTTEALLTTSHDTPQTSPGPARPWPLTNVPQSAQDVWAATYPDFVAMVNQTNVMPGAYATLNTWAIFSHMSASSSVLDVACSTGFSSRELARLTGCSAVGFDISESAVRLARFNHASTDPALRLAYVTADGTSYQPPHPITHVVVGAALGFFPDPQAMARRLSGFLVDGGFVLASPFWVEQPLPEHASAIRREVFGITGHMETYKEATAMFRGFDVMHESRHTCVPETDDEIEHYCNSTVSRAATLAMIDNPEVIDAMTQRLTQVKQATNVLREYQRYSVLVLRLHPSTYPARYVELF